MKITVEQLKKLIREQVEEARFKSVARTPFTKYVIGLGGEHGWINNYDTTEQDTYVKNIESIFITDAGVLVIAYRNGNANEYDLFDNQQRDDLNLDANTAMKMILMATKEGLIRPHQT